MRTWTGRHTGPVLILLSALTACGTAAGPSRSSSPVASRATTPAPAPTVITVPTSLNPPSARYGAALGFDPVSNRLLLFGGSPQSHAAHPQDRLADTWAWDGHTWTHLSPAHSPPSLYGARLTLDPTSRHLLLLSGAGQTDSSGAVQQQGMWSWDGSDWTRVADNPLQIPFAEVASDPSRGMVVLSGGDAGYPSACSVGADCPFVTGIDVNGAHVWDGSRWTNAAGSTPSDQVPYTSRGGTAYDPITHRVISYGGFEQNDVQETFAWDGVQWAVVGKPALGRPFPDPAWPGSTAAAATDPVTASILMVAHSTGAPNLAVSPATWRFDGHNWMPVRGAVTPTLVDESIVADAAVGGLILVGVTEDGSALAMYRWTAGTWQAIP